MLNNIGLPGLLLIAVVVLVLFGRGKVSSLMGEVGKGITAFKKGVNDGRPRSTRAAPRRDAARDREGQGLTGPGLTEAEQRCLMSAGPNLWSSGSSR